MSAAEGSQRNRCWSYSHGQEYPEDHARQQYEDWEKQQNGHTALPFHLEIKTSSTSSLLKEIIVQQLTKEKHHNCDTRLHCLSLIPCRYPLRDRTSVSWDSFQELIGEVQPILLVESLATIVLLYPEYIKRKLWLLGWAYYYPMICDDKPQRHTVSM